jgi:hypothetical protein
MWNDYNIFHGPTMGWPVWQAILSLQLDRLKWTKSLNGLYPALLKPLDRCVSGSDHDSINVLDIPPGGSANYAANLCQLVASPNQRQWDLRKTETGITKPSLILGLAPSRCLGIPFCMTTDSVAVVSALAGCKPKPARYPS